MIGVTGWAFDQIAALTFPRLLLVLEGQGRILYPRLRFQIEANFAQMDKEAVGKVLKRHREALEGRLPPMPTPEERDRAEAFQILYGAYTGDTQAPRPTTKEVFPVPGLPAATARAIVAYANAGHFPSDVWAKDVAPSWLAILKSAEG